MRAAIAGVVAIATVAAVAYVALRPEPAPVAVVQPAVEVKVRSLKLYCQFYVFTEQRPRLALLFEVAERDGRPVFAHVYLAEDNGTRTDHDGASEPRPEWTYDGAPQPRTISSKIMIPDTSQAGLHEEDILIQLYDYEPARDRKEFFEASLKNVHYQNLPGKCRQSRE